MEKTLSYEAFNQKNNEEYLDRDGALEPFNVYHLHNFIGMDKPMPYSRKDYYKISLISGPGTVYYADKTLEVKDNMLLFANPLIPYNWAPLPANRKGAFCVFTDEFFKGFGDVLSYPVFKPDGVPVLSLSDEEFAQAYAILNKMFEEIASSYEYKLDALRTITMELLHTAMKLRPAAYKQTDKTESTAAERITDIFMELLERQFPIESPHQQIRLHSPSQFADQLNVHNNHLNKALKEVTGKTTSKLIGDRIAREARALLKHTNWTIAEIAFTLGFEDPSYFIKFFKKNNTQATPRSFRSA